MERKRPVEVTGLVGLSRDDSARRDEGEETLDVELGAEELAMYEEDEAELRQWLLEQKRSGKRGDEHQGGEGES